jgi:hypothetical protein
MSLIEELRPPGVSSLIMTNLSLLVSACFRPLVTNWAVPGLMIPSSSITMALFCVPWTLWIAMPTVKTARKMIREVFLIPVLIF